jgi:hypothetical protein
MPSAVALMNYISSGLLWRIFCQTGTFRGVFSPYISFITQESAGGISAAIRELYCTFADFLQNWNFPQNNTISPKETAKLRWPGWGAVDIIFFRVPCRMRQA